MASLYLFNPENDLALATGMPHYTPPAAATRLSHDGAYLPMWTADGDDTRMVMRAEDTDWVERCRDMFDIKMRPLTESDTITRCVPWGWSAYACRRFADLGVSPETLPPAEALDVHRMLSHRRTTIRLHAMLSERLPYPLPPVPEEITDAETLERRINDGHRLFLKSPWSSSGRGVLDTDTVPPRQAIRQALGVIHRQGSILSERGLDRIADFAMLFRAEAGKVRFAGYSMFFNDSHSAYTGNLLADDCEMYRRLCAYVPADHIEATRETAEQALTAIIGSDHTGWLGVDMMIYNRDGQMLIAPCVEINLRCTMGVVAHLWHKLHLAPGSEGTFRIIPRYSDNQPVAAPVIDSRRLVDGTIRLSPPSAATFSIEVKAKRDR